MSFPRYPAYKDSGVEWLGEVPEHWEVDRLKYIAKASPSNVDKKSYDGDPAVLLCNYTDVYYNEEIVAGMSFMAATATTDQVEKFTLRAGDTIITKDSETADDIAISAYVPQNLPGVVCGYHLSLIRPREGADGRFIKRLFDSHFARATLGIAANGLTRYGLSQYPLDNFELPLPPAGERTAIATFLDRETAKIDALVADYRTLIELLQEKRQAVISHAVTKGLDPTVPMKDSGVEWLGEVPNHWRPIKIRHLFKQEKRQGFPDLRVLSVYRDFGVIDKDGRDDNFNKTPDDLSAYQLVEPGDLVINKMKAWQGSLGISELGGITSPDYIVYASKHAENPRFIHYMLRQENLKGVYQSISNGIRPQQWRLEPNLFEQLIFFMPPDIEKIAIVDHIESRVRAIDSLADEAEEAITLLQERRTALISAAITGKIDVRGLVIETPPVAVPESNLAISHP